MPELALIFLPTFIFMPSIRCLYCLKEHFEMKTSKVKNMDFPEMIFINYSRRFSVIPRRAWLDGSPSERRQYFQMNGRQKACDDQVLGSIFFFFFSQWLSFSFRLPSLVSSRCPHFLLRSSFALFESWHLAWARMRDRGGRAVGGGPTGWAQGSGTQMQAETSKRTYSVFFCS